jgi:hypothetical protein
VKQERYLLMKHNVTVITNFEQINYFTEETKVDLFATHASHEPSWNIFYDELLY